MAQIHDKIQVLDQTCGLWREGEILEIEDEKFRVRFLGFNSKHDGFHSKGELYF